MEALTVDDAVVATYREHGHALARGVPADAVMAEMYGKVEGTSRGRGGSMHLFDRVRHFYGGNAIVGGGLPIAAGHAPSVREPSPRVLPDVANQLYVLPASGATVSDVQRALFERPGVASAQPVSTASSSRTASTSSSACFECSKRSSCS